MTSDGGHFYVVIEAMKDKHGQWASAVDEYDGDFNLVERRFVDFTIETENKGFEGIAYVYRAGNGACGRGVRSADVRGQPVQGGQGGAHAGRGPRTGVSPGEEALETCDADQPAGVAAV